MSDTQRKAQDLGMKISKCLQMLAWLYDNARDEAFPSRVAKAPTGYGLLDEGGEIIVKEVKHIGPSTRYSVTLNYWHRPVIQANGQDIAELAKGMARSVAENLGEQVMSIFAEEPAQ